VNARLVDDIANAVLYEGYILYPYRPTALKNRHRFNFGVIAPIDEAGPASGEKCRLQTECVIRGTRGSTLTVTVRFLQIVDRRICHLVANHDDVSPRDTEVDSLEVDGRVIRGWQEAVEREITVSVGLGDLSTGDVRRSAEWSGADEAEPLLTSDGQAVGSIVRRKESLRAQLDVSGRLVGDRLFKITVGIANLTPPSDFGHAGREGWLMRALVSTHAIVRIEGGECLSLVDPPADARDLAESCRQVGLWPVLVGEPSDRDALLASPIILYDYPQIAPESAGDFCDGTEIDEMLALRVLTMTDDEKLEMRQGDERARLILERTETLSHEHMMKLHGVLRGLRSAEQEDGR